MADVQYDVSYTEQRNRLTTAFRIILAIPHLFIAQAWGSLIWAISVVQWFQILFTGKRSEGIFNMQNQWLGYTTRVNSYVGLMFDEYPKFGTDPSGVPMVVDATFTEPANRVTSAFRLILAIPAMFVFLGLAIAASVVGLVLWFAILFTGKANRGMWDFLYKVHRYIVRATAYIALMTDDYPKYS
jgi:hypothetical protein